ncbi:MAG: penicillin acylase family protein [Pseudomonadales bacterium]|nr:penicillin acylase family protein [Pseudomonadales bacterium]
MAALRWWQRVLLVLVVVAVLAVAVATMLLRGSLARLDGSRKLSGLTTNIRIERDELGTATVHGASRSAVAYGLGFAHAQDRFFQMDLSRRLAAGELSELFGEATLEQDRTARRWRFRAAARQVMADATEADRGIIEAYTRGVNAGLDDLGSRPFEYWLLRLQPALWRPEDSVLVVYAMWWDLQHAEIERERQRERVLAAAPPELVQFLYRRGTEFDAPIAQTGAPAQNAPITGSEVFDLRSGDQSDSDRPSVEHAVVGSNNWAVAGELTATGAALVANDMHLGLRVPPVWYRSRLIVDGGGNAAPPLDLIGITLPGVPALVAGSNRRIAWGYTNSYGDWSDVRQVACSDRSLTIVSEQIAVRDHAAVPLSIRVPIDAALSHQVVVQESSDGERCTLAAWLARARGATNFRIFGLERARSVGAALELMATVGIPQQNIVIGDQAGRIAWSILGRVPRGEDAERLWRAIEWRDVSDHPTIVDPAIGRIWSANSRAVDGPLEEVIGSDEVNLGVGYDFGARAQQIRDRLLAVPRNATPADMLAIQLDDRAVAMQRWRDLLVSLLDEAALRDSPQRAEFQRLIERWDAHAAVSSVGYRLVRTYHDRVSQAQWQAILRRLDLPTDGIAAPASFEAAIWQLVNDQPANFLAPGSKSWRQFLLGQVDRTIKDLQDSCESLATCTWGERTPVAIRHPLSASMPILERWLDMPTLQLPGDNDMPRVQVGAFGASERFAVSPGAEEEGYLQLAGGQSGHPLSPFYRAGFRDWASGRPTPFLPGPALHKLVLLPRETPADGEP